jgi:hypothetical protein
MFIGPTINSGTTLVLKHVGVGTWCEVYFVMFYWVLVTEFFVFFKYGI